MQYCYVFEVGGKEVYFYASNLADAQKQFTDIYKSAAPDLVRRDHT